MHKVTAPQHMNKFLHTESIPELLKIGKHFIIRSCTPIPRKIIEVKAEVKVNAKVKIKANAKAKAQEGHIE